MFSCQMLRWKMFRCKMFRWQGEYRKCSEMFTMTKTDDGYCCSFNTVSVQSTFAREETSTIDYESEE